MSMRQLTEVVLLVGPDSEHLKEISRELRNLNYVVHTANSGEDGLRWVFVQRSTNKVLTMEIPRGNPLAVGSTVSVELTVRGTGLNAAVKDALRT